MGKKSLSPLIELNNIVKKYGDFYALKDFSISIYEGEFIALLGPSGCGKTTLLRTMAGFSSPTSGDVLIEGRSVKNDSPNYRPVNTVFQNYALFPHMTVAENVAFGPRQRRISKPKIQEKVKESLELVGMQDFHHRYPSELSGGQQQRVSLARAIINEPKVLLLDEPLAALDLKLRNRMQLELKRIQEKLGITFIIVTHDQEEALVMADRIVVMSNGKIEQCDTGENIYTNPESQFVADFIGEANLLDCYINDDGQLLANNLGAILPYRVSPPFPDKISLMIRPENIYIGELSSESNSHVNSYGTVRDVVYAGAVRRIYVNSPLSEEIVITQSDLTRKESIEAGQEISFSWQKDDARVLAQ